MGNVIIFLIFPLFILFRLYVIFFVPLTPYVAEPILFSDLLGKPIFLSPYFKIGIGLINLMFIMLISKRLVTSKIWYIPAFLYTISPWNVYLETGGSLYILVLTFLMLMFVGFKFVKNNRLSFSLVLIAASGMLYTSLLMWFALPLLIFGLFKLNFFDASKFKAYILGLFIICLPLIFASITNFQGLRNIFSNQVSVFSEVGLVNAVNTFRGEIAQTNFSIFGKLTENRYFYLSEHLVFNLLKHLTPVTYFTPEFKMFDFSFSPPLLLGFLLPFMFGLKNIFDFSLKNKWVFLVILSLILPSILSKNSPDLNRLVLITPVMFVLIAEGFKTLITKKSVVYKLLLALTLIIVFSQLLTVISDIFLRENMRLFQIKK